MFAVGIYAVPAAAALFVGGVATAVAAFALLLLFPRRANLLVAAVVLPAGTGTSSALQHVWRCHPDRFFLQ